MAPLKECLCSDLYSQWPRRSSGCSRGVGTYTIPVLIGASPAPLFADATGTGAPQDKGAGSGSGARVDIGYAVAT